MGNPHRTSPVSWGLEKLVSFPKVNGIWCRFLSRPGWSALLRGQEAVIDRSNRASALNAHGRDGTIGGCVMQVSFHLVFRGQCEAAFQFYERALGGKIVNILTYGNSPATE